ncbi:MAG: ankyrin repeat domain-containing protein, partial [Bacteroidia bacterium]|nr:ankyrin repeat domain-containing protein [Bacteroidia bacterium]
QGADPDRHAGGIYVGRLPLHYAVTERSVDMARILLEADANPLKPDHEGKSALRLASQCLQSAKLPVFKDLVELLESYV